MPKDKSDKKSKGKKAAAKKAATKKAATKAEAAVKEAKPAKAKKGILAKKPVVAQAKHAVPHGDIRIRAYYIAERRVKLGWPGDSHSDWIEAERQIRAEIPRPK